jgi:26S proteasome regulatory subunit N6
MGNLLLSCGFFLPTTHTLSSLAKAFSSQRNFEEVLTLLRDCNAFFTLIPKAKTAKIVRSIIDIISTFPDTLDVQIHLCREVVEWCKVEKRTFLRQRIESKVRFFPSCLIFVVGKFVAPTKTSPRSNGSNLSFAEVGHFILQCSWIFHFLRELKKLDDKQMLTEVHLLESRINHSLQNIPKGTFFLSDVHLSQQKQLLLPLAQMPIRSM